MGNDKNSSGLAGAPQSDGGAKKKRHWLRRLAIVLAAIGLLVFAAPYIVASRPVLGWILSSVNDGIRGRIEIDELSLSWFSPPSVRGLRVLDADRRSVLSVLGIRAGKSLLALAAGPMDFGRIDVDDPNVILYRMSDGRYSLDEAFSSTGPPKPDNPDKPDKPAGELPRLRGKIAVHRGSVTVVDLTGERLVLTEANSEIEKTLDRLIGRQSVRFPDGAVLKTEYDLAGLVQDGKFQPGGVTGTMRVWTDKPINLAPLGRFAMPDKGLAGTLGIDANVTMYQGKPRGEFNLSLADLKADQGYAAKVKPASFTLTATAAQKDKDVAGKMNLGGDLGGLDGTYSYRPGPMPDLTAEKLISALLSGEIPPLHEMTLDANASIDLAALANAVPSLLGVRKDVTVTGGTAKLTSLKVRGGKAPVIELAAGLDGVTAMQTQPDGRQKPIELKPISLNFDSRIVEKSGLDVRRIELSSAFASLDGNGTPKHFHARYNADLAVARDEIGKIIDLKQLALAGKLSGSISAAMNFQQRLNYGFNAKADGVSIADGNQPPLTVQIATLVGNGYLTHKAGKDVKVAAEMFTLGVEDSLTISGKASLDAATGALDANAVIQKADLAGLWAKASAMGAAGPKAMGGRTSGRFKVTRQDSGSPFKVAGGLVGDDLSADGNALLPAGEQLIVRLPDLSMDRATGRYVVRNFSAELGKASSLTGNGRFSSRTGAMDANATVARGDLAGVLALAKAFGVQVARPVTGTFGGTIFASRKSSAEPIAAEARLDVKDAKVDGKPISRRDIELVATDLRALGPQVGLSAGKVTLTSDAASLTVTGLNVRTGETLALAGDIEASADMAHVSQIASAFGDPNAKPIQLSGQLNYKGKAEKTGARIAFTGRGGIERFRAGAEPNAVAVEPLTFTQDILIDPDTDLITIRSAAVDSGMLNLTASGTISSFRTQKVLDVRGHYRGAWDKVLAVARQFAPSAGEVAITGPLESDFVLTGPADKPTLTPVYRDMQANAGVTWQTAQMLGFALGQANVPVTLQGGKVVVPDTKVSATGGGAVNLAATLDLAPKDAPQLTMPGRLLLLDNVQINKEVGQKVLSRINPVFNDVISLQGRITLVAQDIDVPLGEAIKKRGAGSGRMDLTELQIAPAGLLGQLLEFGGLGGKQLVQMGAVDFAIRDGALTYDNFTMTFGKSFDLRFRGAVRFDKSLALFVSVPVRAELLKKLGVGGSAAKYAELLDGARVEIPILGTIDKPRLDMAKVDIQPLLKQAAEKMIGKEAGGLLEGLLKGKKPDGPAPPPQPAPQGEQPKEPAPAGQDRPSPTTQKAPTTTEEMLIRTIFDVLNQVGKSKDKKK